MVHHLVFVTGPTIGHVTPLVALAAKLVHDNPEFIITVPTLGEYGGVVEKLLAKHFATSELHLKENVRLINIGGEGKAPYPLIEYLLHNYEAFYSSLLAEEDMKCATGRIYPAIAKPRMILLDYFLYDLLLVTRKVSQHRIPILAWISTGTAYTLYNFGPEHHGGRGDLSQKAVIIAEKNGTSFEETEVELYFSYSLQGQVVKLPGLPPLFDYELVQRDDMSLGQLDAFTLKLIKTSRKFLLESDGAVSTGNEAYEPELIAAFRDWFGQENKPIYFIGPMLPPDTLEHSIIAQKRDSELSPDGKEVQAFLDRVLESHGEKSLLFISFGSYFWPTGDNIWKVCETIIELRIPFIISYKRDDIPPHAKALLESYENCLNTKWAPQHVILAHSATGWFLTHCGQNSITEAIYYGAPMIAWPLHGDQQVNAIKISVVHDLGYKLEEVGIGTGLRPQYTGYQPKGTHESITQEFKDIWVKARGEDGTRKRSNVQKLQEKFKALWEANGSSLRDFKRLSETSSKD